MFLKHFSAFNPAIRSLSTSHYVRKYCSERRNIKIGNVAFEKTIKSKNPEYVPKKFSKILKVLNFVDFIKF